jgi:acyl carrier protein
VIIDCEASSDMTTTFDGLRAIIVRDFELPPEQLARDTALEQIELDSLAVTELVFSLEDEFGVTADNAVPAFVTLGDIADYVDRLLADREANGSASAAPAARNPPARAGATSAAAKPQTPPAPKRRRNADSTRSDGRAR